MRDFYKDECPARGIDGDRLLEAQRGRDLESIVREDLNILTSTQLDTQDLLCSAVWADEIDREVEEEAKRRTRRWNVL